MPPGRRLTLRGPPRSKPPRSGGAGWPRRRRSSASSEGAAGLITLNRPQGPERADARHGARACAARSTPGRPTRHVTRVVVTGAGERAFCAGGDIRQLYELGRAGRRDEALAFWREEYAAQRPHQAAIRSPMSSLIDGIVMGGGVGVSLHGSHRVAGDRYALRHAGGRHRLLPGRRRDLRAAAPAGRDRHLSRADGRAGAAPPTRSRSGSRPMPCPRAALRRRARRRSIAGEPVDAVLAAAAARSGRAPLAASADVIDACFRGPTASRTFCRGSTRLRRTAPPSRPRRPPRCARSRRRACASRSSRCGAAARSTSRRRCAPSSASSRASSTGTISTRACAPP